MEQLDVDCVLVPPARGAPTRLGADVRYLTQVGGWDEYEAGALLPLSADPIVTVRDAEGWRQLQPWCSNLEEPSIDVTSSLIARLDEIPLPHRRIGVVGLSTRGWGSRLVSRDLEQMLVEEKALTCVDFTAQMDGLRLVKSPEEIAFLEQSARIASASQRRAVEGLRAGASEREVWATLVEAALSLGSDAPVEVNTSRELIEHRQSRPGDSVIDPGWLSVASVVPAWGGYRARCDQPISCGRPHELDAELMRLAADLWNSLVVTIQSGVPASAVASQLERATAVVRPRSGALADTKTGAVIRGCGLGQDEPRLVLGKAPIPREHPCRIVEDSCLFLGVWVAAGPRVVSWGDSVVVTSKGIRRLGDHPQAILTF